MKKTGLYLVIAVLLLPLAAQAGQTGVGIYGGTLYPVVQEDQESGYVFGAKVRFQLTGPLLMEPHLTLGSFGNVEIAGVGERDGSSFTHYGIDLVLGSMAGPGPKPYAFIGGAIYNSKRDHEDAINKSGWSFGLGLALGVTQLIDVDVRGRFNIVSSETMTGSATRKSVGATAGVTYYFGAGN